MAKMASGMPTPRPMMTAWLVDDDVFVSAGELMVLTFLADGVAVAVDEEDDFEGDKEDAVFCALEATTPMVVSTM